MEFQGFPRLICIFYAYFHPLTGRIVKAQVPDGSIYDARSSGLAVSGAGPKTPTLPQPKPLIEFEVIQEYTIPQNFCNKLISFYSPTSNHVFMGLPVKIEDHEKYGISHRNTFLFNFVFCFERGAAGDIDCYEPIVRKMARVMTTLEVETSFLLKDEDGSAVQNIIEQLIEDLNSYGECQIPVNSSCSINMKLFPTYPNPPPVYDYQVPVCMVNLDRLKDVNWDLSMLAIIKYIDGVNHVKRIAELADVDPQWTRLCIQHLVYYGCVILIDIFQFSNIYTVTTEFISFLENASMDAMIDAVCLTAIFVDAAPIPISKLIDLYCNLKHGITVREWVQQYDVEALPIDVRRFISFGIIKAILHRVNTYPILDPPAYTSSAQSMQTLAMPPAHIPMEWLPYLDGTHHLDEICTEFGKSAKKVRKILTNENEAVPPPLPSQPTPSEKPERRRRKSSNASGWIKTSQPRVYFIDK
ncbi:hypothetical protein BZG36_02715 [Bifiguratus adelaidae]|uniref:Nitrogen permease regulator 2 n=1 Tax=Bifiguratus adelaidae TaxID=1938954 RepID=A0A261Y1R5_9FUNG|nr:hypothetical protein BZG36_02715 [Bifiguratus adelaidae]